MQIEKRPLSPGVPQHLEVGEKKKNQDTEKEWPWGVLEAKGGVQGEGGWPTGLQAVRGHASETERGHAHPCSGPWRP